MSRRREPPVRVLTIGHSTRPIEEFVALLRAHEVDLLADVRTVPRSRHNPQFSRESLPGSLGEAGIGYIHLPGLGGLRRPRPDSANAAWHNASFRGYADYMQTDDFQRSLDELVDLARVRRVAVMCAEAVPWRCHRSLIADALVARGVTVEHILGPARRDPHALRDFARVEGGRVTYPGDNAELWREAGD